MTYTGYMEIKPDPRKPRLSIMLPRLDAAAASIGLTLDLPELTKARACQTRADELRRAYSDHKAQARAKATDAAREYAAGKIDAATVLEQVGASALLTGEADTHARQLVEEGAAAVEATGAPLLHNVSEAKWLKVIRPVVAAALDHANAVADELGIEGPRPQPRNIVSATHPWAPTAQDLKDIDTRHRWEKLEDALDKLDQAHTFADLLRDWGMLPVVEGRTHREDYRWLHTARLRGNLTDRRVFFLANRHTAEPGIYTAAELTAAAPPKVRELGVDRYTANDYAASAV